MTARKTWVLTALLLIAGAVRAGLWDDSRFIAERQYRSALIARADFLSGVDDVEEWRADIARISAERMSVLEPPIMEVLAVAGYRILGDERLWWPRGLASLFWLIAAHLLFLLARRLTGPEAALYATAYFLFLPLGLQVSVSFIPDPLMIMLFLAGLLGMVKHEDEPSLHRLVMTGLLCGACVLVKPLCLFALVGAFAALRLQRSGVRGLFDGSALAIGAFLLLPTASYYLYGIYSGGLLASQASWSLLPGLLLQPAFWVRTASTALASIGVCAALLALIGLPLPPDRTFRPVVFGTMVGWGVFCLVFTYHVRSIGYYHLQLAVPTALCLGPAIQALVDRVRQADISAFVRGTSLATCGLLITVLVARDISTRFATAPPIVEPAVARLVGDAVRHSDKVVYVSQYYGVPLEYYGELSGTYWPRAATPVDRALSREDAVRRSVEERLASLRTRLAEAQTGSRPEYFVITDFREYAHHEDLAAYLEDECQRIAADPSYLIYRNCPTSPGG